MTWRGRRAKNGQFLKQDANDRRAARERTVKRKTYDATVELGIPVTLIDAVSEDADGAIELPRSGTLLATVAVARVLDPARMVGAELRYLRHVLDRTGSEFADALDLSDKTVVSRWENGATRPGPYTEKVIRQLVLNLLARSAPGIEIADNAIPGMKLRPRGEPLPMAFALRKRRGEDGRARQCYVPVPPVPTAAETAAPAS